MAINDVPIEHRIYLWTCFSAVLFGYLVNLWTWRVAGRRKLATIPGPVMWSVQYALLNNNLYLSTLIIWIVHTAAVAGSYWFNASPTEKVVVNLKVEMLSALCVGFAASRIVWCLWNLSAVGVDITASASETLLTLRPVSKARLIILCALVTFYAYFGGIQTHEAYITTMATFVTSLSSVITAGSYQLKRHWWGALSNGWRGWTVKAFFPYPLLVSISLYTRIFKHTTFSYTSFFSTLLSNPVLGEYGYGYFNFQSTYGLRIFAHGIIIPGYTIIFSALIMMRCLRFDHHKSHFIRVEEVREEEENVSSPPLPITTSPPISAEDKVMIDTSVAEKDPHPSSPSSQKPTPTKTKTKTLAPIHFRRPYFRLASSIYVLTHLAILFALYASGKKFATLGGYALWSHQLVESVLVLGLLGMAWMRGDLGALWNFD